MAILLDYQFQISVVITLVGEQALPRHCPQNFTVVSTTVTRHQSCSSSTSDIAMARWSSDASGATLVP